SLGQSSAEVSLDDEFELCRRYLRMEQLRLGERLRVRWDVDAVPTTLPIPALSLQPLLENAIYHGIQARSDGGELAVTGQWQGGELRLMVCNPLADTTAAPRIGNRMALDNSGHRLRALYGDDAGVAIRQDAGQFWAELFYRPGERP